MEPTAAELIRLDLSPVLMQLYGIYDGVARSSRLRIDRPPAYSPPNDHYMVLNYGLLGSGIALVLWVLAATGVLS